jgi:hypothetical protein
MVTAVRWQQRQGEQHGTEVQRRCWIGLHDGGGDEGTARGLVFAASTEEDGEQRLL